MQICNHPCLSYWPVYEYDKADLVKRCGKFRMLDRLLVKLHASGHRVLLFSTMTKLLDLLEEYLRWREVRPGETMGYLRIDGATSLEDRSAPWPAGLCSGSLPHGSSHDVSYCSVSGLLLRTVVRIGHSA